MILNDKDLYLLIVERQEEKFSLGSPRDFPVRERRRVGDGRGTPGRSEP